MVSSRVKEIKKKGTSLPMCKSNLQSSSNLSQTHREINKSGLKDYKSFDMRSASRSGNVTARGQNRQESRQRNHLLMN